MATYKPKVKTSAGLEEVKLPRSSVDGLEPFYLDFTIADDNINIFKWDYTQEFITPVSVDQVLQARDAANQGRMVYAILNGAYLPITFIGNEFFVTYPVITNGYTSSTLPKAFNWIFAFAIDEGSSGVRVYYHGTTNSVPNYIEVDNFVLDTATNCYIPVLTQPDRSCIMSKLECQEMIFIGGYYNYSGNWYLVDFYNDSSCTIAIKIPTNDGLVYAIYDLTTTNDPMIKFLPWGGGSSSSTDLLVSAQSTDSTKAYNTTYINNLAATIPSISWDSTSGTLNIN